MMNRQMQTQRMSGTSAKIAAAQAEFLKLVAKRSELCKGTHRSNCIGTALYLVGEQPSDKYISTLDVPQLEKLQKAETPEIGLLVAWECGPERWTDERYRLCTEHLGVITDTRDGKLFVTNRYEVFGDFGVNEPIEKTEMQYRYPHDPDMVAYYLPTGLKLAKEQGIIFEPPEGVEQEQSKYGEKEEVHERRSMKEMLRGIFKKGQEYA